MIVRFAVPGKPGHWARTGGDGKRRFKTADTRAFEARVATFAAAALSAAGCPMIQGPVRLTVVAVYTRPRQLAMVLRSTGRPKYGIHRLDKTSTPDLDNVVKGVKDGLKGIAWRDDSQVSRYGEAGKFWAEMRMNIRGEWVEEPPHIEITVEALS